MFTMCQIEKHIDNFYKKIQNVETATVLEGENDITKTKTKYQINKKFFMKKIEKKYYYRNKTIELYNLEI